MKKKLAIFALGFAAGVAVGYFGVSFAQRRLSFWGKIPPQPPPVCYSCLWEGTDPKLRGELTEFYRQYKNPDQMISADVRYILWRATGNANCDAREMYRRVAGEDQDVYRRLMARAVLGFSGPECGQDGSNDLKAAAELAQQAGLPAESEILRLLSAGKLQPRFEDVKITTSLTIPPDPKTLTLGESTIELTPGLRVGTQVDRVARDWISYQVKWDLTGKPLSGGPLIDYHEGALVKRLMDAVPVEVYPLAGTLVAQKGDKWFAADETGAFRFEVVNDKVEYPTTHAFASFGWIEDTHGVSALVAQALEHHLQLVVGCGDSEGKMKAAFYLAQKGVNVAFPGDRYEDMLLGYQAPGILLGTAPVKKANGKAVIGHQPVGFSVREPIVVEDTRELFPVQYYDAGARYFRRLSESVRLNLDYVNVDAANQIERVLERAAQLKSTAVAVRVVTNYEYETLREWLAKSPNNRAVLFHSGLYPFAQPLFEQYPAQVTFGDLHPRFE